MTGNFLTGFSGRLCSNFVEVEIEHGRTETEGL